MNSKNFFVDLINYLFIIGVIILLGFNLFFGDRFFFSENIKLFLPFALFGLVFLIKVKFRRGTIRKLKEENALHADETCLTHLDKIKDEFVIFFLPIVVIAVAMFNQNVNMIDFAQALAVFLVVYFWHKMLFKGR